MSNLRLRQSASLAGPKLGDENNIPGQKSKFTFNPEIDLKNIPSIQRVLRQHNVQFNSRDRRQVLVDLYNQLKSSSDQPENGNQGISAFSPISTQTERSRSDLDSKKLKQILLQHGIHHCPNARYATLLKLYRDHLKKLDSNSQSTAANDAQSDFEELDNTTDLATNASPGADHIPNKPKKRRPICSQRTVDPPKKRQTNSCGSKDLPSRHKRKSRKNPTEDSFEDQNFVLISRTIPALPTTQNKPIQPLPTAPIEPLQQSPTSTPPAQSPTSTPPARSIVTSKAFRKPPNTPHPLGRFQRTQSTAQSPSPPNSSTANLDTQFTSAPSPLRETSHVNRKNQRPTPTKRTVESHKRRRTHSYGSINLPSRRPKRKSRRNHDEDLDNNYNFVLVRHKIPAIPTEPIEPSQPTEPSTEPSPPPSSPSPPSPPDSSNRCIDTQAAAVPSQSSTNNLSLCSPTADWPANLHLAPVHESTTTIAEEGNTRSTTAASSPPCSGSTHLTLPANPDLPPNISIHDDDCHLPPVHESTTTITEEGNVRSPTRSKRKEWPSERWPRPSQLTRYQIKEILIENKVDFGAFDDQVTLARLYRSLIDTQRTGLPNKKSHQQAKDPNAARSQRTKDPNAARSKRHQKKSKNHRDKASAEINFTPSVSIPPFVGTSAPIPSSPAAISLQSAQHNLVGECATTTSSNLVQQVEVVQSQMAVIESPNHQKQSTSSNFNVQQIIPVLSNQLGKIPDPQSSSRIHNTCNNYPCSISDLNSQGNNSQNHQSLVELETREDAVQEDAIQEDAVQEEPLIISNMTCPAPVEGPDVQSDVLTQEAHCLKRPIVSDEFLSSKDLTVNQMKAVLDKYGVKYTSRDRKGRIIELYDEVRAQNHLHKRKRLGLHPRSAEGESDDGEPVISKHQNRRKRRQSQHHNNSFNFVFQPSSQNTSVTRPIESSVDDPINVQSNSNPITSADDPVNVQSNSNPITLPSSTMVAQTTTTPLNIPDQATIPNNVITTPRSTVAPLPITTAQSTSSVLGICNQIAMPNNIQITTPQLTAAPLPMTTAQSTSSFSGIPNQITMPHNIQITTPQSTVAPLPINTAQSTYSFSGIPNQIPNPCDSTTIPQSSSASLQIYPTASSSNVIPAPNPQIASTISSAAADNADLDFQESCTNESQEERVIQSASNPETNDDVEQPVRRRRSKFVIASDNESDGESQSRTLEDSVASNPAQRYCEPGPTPARDECDGSESSYHPSPPLESSPDPRDIQQESQSSHPVVESEANQGDESTSLALNSHCPVESSPPRPKQQRTPDDLPPSEGLKVNQMKKFLDKYQVKYKTRDRKARIIELYDAMRTQHRIHAAEQARKGRRSSLHSRARAVSESEGGEQLTLPQRQRRKKSRHEHQRENESFNFNFVFQPSTHTSNPSSMNLDESINNQSGSLPNHHSFTVVKSIPNRPSAVFLNNSQIASDLIPSINTANFIQNNSDNAQLDSDVTMQEVDDQELPSSPDCRAGSNINDPDITMQAADSEPDLTNWRNSIGCNQDNLEDIETEQPTLLAKQIRFLEKLTYYASKSINM